MTTKPEVVHEHVDCRNMACPMPIVTMKKTLTKMAVGNVLEMVATDPGSISDVKGWSSQTGHPLLHHETVEVKKKNEYFFYIQKAHD